MGAFNLWLTNLLQNPSLESLVLKYIDTPCDHPHRRNPTGFRNDAYRRPQTIYHRFSMKGIPCCPRLRNRLFDDHPVRSIHHTRHFERAFSPYYWGSTLGLKLLRSLLSGMQLVFRRGMSKLASSFNTWSPQPPTRKRRASFHHWFGAFCDESSSRQLHIESAGSDSSPGRRCCHIDGQSGPWRYFDGIRGQNGWRLY